jgi:hypothetical protein
MQSVSKLHALRNQVFGHVAILRLIRPMQPIVDWYGIALFLS